MAATLRMETLKQCAVPLETVADTCLYALEPSRDNTIILAVLASSTAVPDAACTLGNRGLCAGVAAYAVFAPFIARNDKSYLSVGAICFPRPDFVLTIGYNAAGQIAGKTARGV